MACCWGLKTEGRGEGRKAATRSGSSMGRPSKGWPMLYRVRVKSWACSRMQWAMAVVNSPESDRSRAMLAANSSGEFRGLLMSHSNWSTRVWAPMVMLSFTRMRISSFL